MLYEITENNNSNRSNLNCSANRITADELHQWLVRNIPSEDFELNRGLYGHHVYVPHDDGESGIYVYAIRLSFKNEGDRMLFKLRWM